MLPSRRLLTSRHRGECKARWCALRKRSGSAVNAVIQAGALEADIQSESNVDNSAGASAVNAVVQAGTLEEPLPGPQENAEAA